jgi:PmbA protein
MDPNRIVQFCARVEEALDEARRQGATAAEAGLSADDGFSVSVRTGAVETVEQHRSHGFGITVYMGRSKGSASTTDLGEEALRDTVRAACQIARYSAEDPYAGLPDAELLAREFPDLDIYHPWDVSVEQGIHLALECEDQARATSPEITNSEGTSFGTYSGVRVLGNSLGFLHGYPYTRHNLSCSVVAQRDAGMQRDRWWTVARDPDDLEAPTQVGRRAAERALRRLGGRTLSTRVCPVIFAPEVAAGLLGHFVSAIGGGNLYRKSSFLVDSLGRSVFPSFIRIHEQPDLPRAVGSVPYDAEGVATHRHDLVTDGEVRSYVLSTYSARRLGMRSTGNAGGVHNLTLDPGDADLPELLRQMNRGLLVAELLGQGVNLVTGDYSRGAAGFWVDGGTIQFPVEGITIAGNLRAMFGGVVAVGSDVDDRGNTRTGSLLVDQMTVAGH